MEMEAVADIFDGDGDGFIDYKEFVTALRPDRQDVRFSHSRCNVLVVVFYSSNRFFSRPSPALKWSVSMTR